MIEQNNFQNSSYSNDSLIKIRNLEEKQRMLKDRLLLIGENLIDMREKNREEILGMKNYPMLIMGIGFKQEGKNRRVHHKNDQYMFGTIKKQPIQINYVY